MGTPWLPRYSYWEGPYATSKTEVHIRQAPNDIALCGAFGKVGKIPEENTSRRVCLECWRKYRRAVEARELGIAAIAKAKGAKT